MKLVIDIPEERFKDIQRIAEVQIERNHFLTAEQIIANGTPLEQTDVPNFESEEYIEQRLENYNKLLKSGILDCVTEKPQESEDKG